MEGTSMKRLLRTSSVLAVWLLGVAALAQYPMYNPFALPAYVPAPLYLPAPYVSSVVVAPFTGQTATVFTSPFGNSVSLNGKSGPWEYAITGLTFSPNGTRWGYLAQNVPGGPWFAVVDGVFSPTFAAISNLIFSPDGMRVGYLAQVVPGGPWIAVVDGIDGPPYDTVNSLAFSPDSRHFAYNAWTSISGQWLVVVDGVANLMSTLSHSAFSTSGNGVTILLDPFTGGVVAPSTSLPGLTPGASTQTPKTADQLILGL
jgi:hypothetical protein